MSLTGMNDPLSVEFGNNSKLVHCYCACGKDLGMRNPEDVPNCGEDECIEYLESHPNWYEAGE